MDVAAAVAAVGAGISGPTENAANRYHYGKTNMKNDITEQIATVVVVAVFAGLAIRIVFKNSRAQKD